MGLILARGGEQRGGGRFPPRCKMKEISSLGIKSESVKNTRGWPWVNLDGLTNRSKILKSSQKKGVCTMENMITWSSGRSIKWGGKECREEKGLKEIVSGEEVVRNREYKKKGISLRPESYNRPTLDDVPSA